MKTKILVMLLAMLATISTACKVGEIQLNGSGACVTDCGKHWESSKITFRNCTINQLGSPAKDDIDYYMRLPADTPQKRFYTSLNNQLQQVKKKGPQRKRNGRGNGTRHH